MSDGKLERRYRRLLRAYPAAYRHERGDEIVGVLLDGAADRNWPSAGEAADLVRSGFATRARGGHRSAARIAWAEGASVMAVLVAVFLAVRGVGYGFDALRWLDLADSYPGAADWYTLSNYRSLYFGEIGWPVSVGWIVVAPALLARRRRLVPVLAVLATAVDLVGLARSVTGEGGHRLPTATVAMWVVVGLVTALVLARPARVEAASEVLDGPSIAVLTLGSVVAQWPRTASPVTLWAWVPVLLAVAVLVRRRRWVLATPAGRRCGVLGAAFVALYLLGSGLFRFGLGGQRGAVLFLVVAVLVVGAAMLWARLCPVETRPKAA
jgi:hypothetical protein